MCEDIKAEITDEELQMRLVKIIGDLKKSKAVFRKIAEKTNICFGYPQHEEYTIITKNELAHLKHIEKIFFEIGDLARTTYKYLRGDSRNA